MSDDLAKRLRDTPNWMREGFQDWKDNVRTYDRAPFEAADRIEELEAKLAKAVRFLNGLDRHGVYTTDELEDLLAELKGQDDEQNHQGQIPYWLDSYCSPNKTKGD